MTKTFDERLRRFVNPRFPLGPADAKEIDDPEVAARLFDHHNNAFDSLLRHDLSMVIGRRGSGKTALLNCYKYREFISEPASKIKESFGSDFSAYDVVTEIAAHKKFEEMQHRVVGDQNIFRPIESIVEDWAKLIIEYFLADFLLKEGKTRQPVGHLAIINSYLRQNETKFRDEVREKVWGETLWARFNALTWKKASAEYLSQDEIMAKTEEYLANQKKKAVIMFDSLDEYGTGIHVFDRTIGALIRFISRFNRRYECVKIKLVLPSEIFPEVQQASGNPLKDLVSYDQVQWSSIELMRIAAYRYQLFLSLYDEECLHRLGTLDLARRDDVNRFWLRFFPRTQKNRYGTDEDAMTYVLRHTQLLPRQVLRILEKIVTESHEITGGYRQFNAEAIKKGIANMEGVIAGEIFGAFRRIYPDADLVGKAIFGNCPTIFSYNELEDRWRKKGRPLMRSHPDFEMVHFSDMLIRMGIMGLVVKEKETDRYYHGEFGYSLLTPFNIGGGHELCLHPIFSKHFNAARNAKAKAILPQGVSIEDG